MIYATETWSTTQNQNKRKVERKLGIALRNIKRNEWIHNQTKIKDIVTTIK